MSIETEMEIRRQGLAKCQRRLRRIKRLQASLSIRQVAAQVLHERLSRELWEMENGLKLRRRSQDITEHDAERATALLLAFDPMRNTTKHK